MQGGASSSQLPRHLSFFRVLLPDFTKKLPLPQDFSLREHQPSKATLVSPNGSAWHVKVKTEGGSMFFFAGKDWKTFTVRHELAVGHFMVLQHHGEMLFTFSIFILSCFEKSSYPSSGICIDRSAVNCTCDFGLADSFKKTMASYNLAKPYVYIPLKFKKSSAFVAGEEVTFVDPHDREWVVVVSSLQARKGREEQLYFSRGWLDFVAANDVVVGDTYRFELQSSHPKKVIKVSKV